MRFLTLIKSNEKHEDRSTPTRAHASDSGNWGAKRHRSRARGHRGTAIWAVGTCSNRCVDPSPPRSTKS